MNHKSLPGKICLIWIFSCLINVRSLAQVQIPVTFGTVTADDFTLPKSDVVDSNSNAVIIASVGSVQFVGNKYNGVSWIFTKKVRIKILDKKAFDAGTVYFSLSGLGNRKDQLDSLHATTYNLENGVVKESELKSQDVYNEKMNSWRNQVRFSMPDIKVGSIIEYSFSIISSRVASIPTWYFQNRYYPELYSKFEIGIPDIMRYLTIKYGADSLNTISPSDSYNTLHMGTINASTTFHHHGWFMKDVPAFKEENFLVNPDDYLDKLDFEFAQFYNGEDINSIPTTWKDAGADLNKDDYFGIKINADNTSNLSNIVSRVCADNDNDLNAAKKIYAYVRDNFTSENDDDIGVWDDLYDINKAKKGSAAELNMLLIGLLRQKGLYADPLILATRSYSHISQDFPVLDNCNYVLCLLRINSDTLLLDASDPNMGFGKIPLDCYNGLSEIIDKQYTDPLYLYPNQINDPETTTVLLVDNANGPGESGSLENVAGYYHSADLRPSLKTKDAIDELFKKISNGYDANVQLSNFKIDSIDSIDYPLKISYDLNFKSGFDDDVIYFNPVLNKMYKENPFDMEDRKYPVEFSYPINKTYDLTMDIPNGYTVDELPKSVAVQLNSGEGQFIYQITKDAYTVQLHMQLWMFRATFPPDDYKSLREFFTMVVNKQNEQVVFKKK
jgi:Domain of Unknown Function with PDB structure (DUF3857)